MAAGPEVVRMNTSSKPRSRDTKEFKPRITPSRKTKILQVTFAKQVQRMVQVMHEEMGNPFLEETNDLLKLDNKDIVDQAVTTAVCQAVKIGQQQHDDFVTRLKDQSIPISQPIKKNKLSLFSRPPVRVKLQVSTLKSDVSLFSRLYIAASREMVTSVTFSDMKIRHVPHHVSQFGNLRSQGAVRSSCVP
ncbi:hypothetical protein BSL78_01301 [Apostichopus japonicus]|uniref:Uncharacterized protein n=1 Tax=Stichopus japonicus TaxID=307972 RepID=A0A2G8LNB0_STIJA|nr:hypothetical protein BSL78_01301 [Apostichopus japonicus]